MSGKSFVLTLACVLVLGGVIGGAFVAGLVVGGGSDDGEAAANVLTLPPPGGSGSTAPTSGVVPSGGMSSRGEVLITVEGGEISEEEVAQLRRQLGEGFGGARGGLGPGMAGGGVLIGTVESVEGDKVTVNTAQGPLEVTVGSETAIQRPEIVTLTLDDLSEGLQVQVAGQPNEAGVMEATSIFVVPEEGGGFGGFGGGRGP